MRYVMSQTEWKAIGEKTGWIHTAQIEQPPVPNLGVGSGVTEPAKKVDEKSFSRKLKDKLHYIHNFVHSLIHKKKPLANYSESELEALKIQVEKGLDKTDKMIREERKKMQPNMDLIAKIENVESGLHAMLFSIVQTIGDKHGSKIDDLMKELKR